MYGHGRKNLRADTPKQAGCFTDRLGNTLLLQDNKGFNELEGPPGQLAAT